MTGQVVMVCLGERAGRPGHPGPEGQYLASYDPEGNDGWGHANWTRDLGKAMVFDGAAAAHACWAQVSQTRPLRPDGCPNRPLTTFTVEMRAVAGVNTDG